MGRLRELNSNREVTLLANHVVGRHERSDLVISDPRVSLEHAAVRWDGAKWLLRDLGSTNRTFVDNAPVMAGESCVLKRGHILDFAAVSAWELLDDTCPRASAVPMDGGSVVAGVEENIIAIDGAFLYRGEDNVWHTGDGRTSDNFRDGDEFVVGERRYRLSLPFVADITVRAQGFVGKYISRVEMTLVSSPGDERIDLTVRCDGEQRNLGRHGNNRVLLWLARQRLEDERQQLPPSLAGWRDVSELAKVTYPDTIRLNTEVFRIRQRFASLHLTDFASVIERDESQIRLGISRLQIREAES